MTEIYSKIIPTYIYCSYYKIFISSNMLKLHFYALLQTCYGFVVQLALHIYNKSATNIQIHGKSK